jgi:hypothetical protein
VGGDAGLKIHQGRLVPDVRYPSAYSELLVPKVRKTKEPGTLPGS